ncbi:unnamed protein product [Darwinula stevensoni]|uniref:ATP-dependent RNA helicase n=1 Tax=Darwinula stevensoni TaxID=69355 RepID=A0A7R8X9P1_9CRUS|nr:unnamed protein product [Darwinula stevensoni]CAG0884591.1 unnamed protein product [Darwinula stevensoni]
MDWKSVPLGDGEVAIDMGEEDWQGFGGLEECTQYTLMKPSELKKNEETGSKEKIHALTIPSAIRDHKDILGAAETGSGKTLAFAIPIIHGILQEKLNSEGLIDGDNKLEALILTPTRELALQVRNHIVAAAKYTDIKILVNNEAIDNRAAYFIYHTYIKTKSPESFTKDFLALVYLVGFVIGGLSQEKQERLLKKRPQIIVATPGRLWELMERVTSYLQNIESVRYLVIDEADRMVEKGHFQELHRILERLNASIARRQTFVFSATLTLVHAPPSRLKSMKAWTKTSDNKLANLMKTIKMNGKPKVVDLTRKLGTAEMLSEARILCGKEEKDMYLYYFLVKHPGRTLVFCNSIDCVRHLKGVFDQLQCQPLWLHASMLQKQRLKNLEKFSSKPQGLLLATDVAARGLDIPGIQHVLHYQVPRTSESYIHRSGRTARAAKEGLSVILMDPSEVSAYRKLCFTLNREADLPVFPIDAELMPSIQDRVKLAQQLALEMHRLEKKSADSKWFEKAAKELDLALSDSDFSRSSDSDDEDKKDEQQEKSKLVGQLRSRLNQLLSQPIAPRRQMGITKYPTRSGKLDLPSVQNEQTALEALQEEKQEPESLKFLRKVKSGKVKKQKQKKLKRRK